MANLSSTFKDDWVRAQYQIFEKMYPNIDKQQLLNVIDRIYCDHIEDYEVTIDNSYTHKTMGMTMTGVYGMIKSKRFITCGGVFFRKHGTVPNPSTGMLEVLLESRKKIKGQLKYHHPDSQEYKDLDLKQLIEKVTANSEYGASGNKISRFFNLYAAQATTGVGQCLTSTTKEAFEMFLANNSKFNRLDECFTFINNVVQEEKTLNTIFIPRVKLKDVVRRMWQLMRDPKPEYKVKIRNYLINLDQSLLKRIYYKNNIYEFIKLERINKILHRIYANTVRFVNPNELPKETEGDFLELWKFIKEFVYYNHLPIERIERYKNDMRKVVITSDTDSNMLTYLEWFEFTLNKILPDVDRDLPITHMDLVFLIVNTATFLTTEVSKAILETYTSRAGVPEDKRGIISMKNEFLAEKFITSSVKKRYVAAMMLREGIPYEPKKLVVMGHDAIKSTTSEFSSRRFMDIVNRNLIQSNLSIDCMLKDLSGLVKEILDSVKAGSVDFLIPKSMKEESAYKNPYSQPQFRSMVIWNKLYPNEEIATPARVYTMKLTLPKKGMMDRFKEEDPEMYKLVMKKVMSDENLAPKGMTNIAINRDKIPDWLIPYIDTNYILEYNIKKYLSVLDSFDITIARGRERVSSTNVMEYLEKEGLFTNVNVKQ